LTWLKSFQKKKEILFFTFCGLLTISELYLVEIFDKIKINQSLKKKYSVNTLFSKQNLGKMSLSTPRCICGCPVFLFACLAKVKKQLIVEPLALTDIKE
jgi:hypothetical protein